MTDTADVHALLREELFEAWGLLSTEERLEGFSILPRSEAEELFLSLPTIDQAELLTALPAADRRSWVRLLPPDDAADVLQNVEDAEREGLLALLDPAALTEVTALLAYKEDVAGGLMNPRYARLRPEMSIDEAIKYLRRLTRQTIENIYYAYVIDTEHTLRGVVSFRELLLAPPESRVRDMMRTELITVPDTMDQERVSELFAQHDLLALPVVDENGRMKGIVTADDIVDVVKEEATEDIQKLGAVEALEAPYMQTTLLELMRKRAPWLVLLFCGQMLTISVMEHYEGKLGAILFLNIFIPIILSSGGNSGSQAATLVVRSLALGEMRLAEWWKVVRREVLIGLLLGLSLGVLGFGRVLFGGSRGAFGDHFVVLGLAVAASIVGVVAWGTIVGSMLPFVLRRLKFDPASASTPFVATLCDVTGLILYFNVATTILAASGATGRT
ncbi:MAG: magnesium transporter [Planctomycetia bacterium]|nr:MAG: magnesium transporter [Planctomycetia bacterium]